VRWFFFAVIAAVAWGARLLGRDVVEDPAGSALLALGCLVIGGALAGEVARRLRLPRITGYLVLGIVAGPHSIGLVTVEDHELLHLFEELALGLIALTAGGEFRLEGIRRRLPSLVAITTGHAVGVLLTVGVLMWVGMTALGWMGPLTPGQRLAAAALLGVIAVAKSPATTIAIITETRARGELVDTVLGVTILKDLVILFLFTWVDVLARSWVEGSGTSVAMLRGVGLEVVASLAVGAVLGALLGAYVVRVGRHVQLVVLVLALTSAELSADAGLEHLLVCLAAGFVVRNLFPRAAAGFLDALEQSSAPVYIVFFGLVGVGLDLGVMAVVGPMAIVYVIVRLGATWVFTGGPARLAGCGPDVVRWAWMGFVAQAGLSLGFAARVRRELPDVGPEIAAVVVAAVVVNQLLGPVLWEQAIRRAGEAHDR
jgi:Kef-type K+ transport system membrane component KefB